MKKEYVKPEIITEDVSIAFTQTCCSPVTSGNRVGTSFVICNPNTCKTTFNNYQS
jgi:hypothetical protein